MVRWDAERSEAAPVTSVLALLLLAMTLLQMTLPQMGGLHMAGVLPVLESRMVNGSAAHEADLPGRPPVASGSSDSWLVIGAYSGLPWNTPSPVTVKNPPATDFTLHNVIWDPKPWMHPLFYGARIQAWSRVSPLGLMIDFTHNKAIARPDAEVEVTGTRDGQPLPPKARLDQIFHRLEFSHGHNMLTLNGLYRLPFGTASLRPYVGLGLGLAIPHTEIRTTESSPFTYEYQVAGPVIQALAGVEIRLPRQVSLFLEYKFTHSRYQAPMTGVKSEWAPIDLSRQLGNWLRGTKPAEGMLTTDLTSQMVISGLAVRLGTSMAAP